MIIILNGENISKRKSRLSYGMKDRIPLNNPFENCNYSVLGSHKLQYTNYKQITKYKKTITNRS